MLSDRPLFSVIMANYNNSEFIESAVKSLVEQTYDRWELIIVDDCSSDKSVEMIENLIRKHPGRSIRFEVNSQNSGVGYTKGRCVDLAKGELVGILDPDDELTPEALEKMVQYHSKHPEASLIYSNCFICGPDLEVRYPCKTSAIPDGTTMLDCWDKPGYSLSHFTCFKKTSYTASGGFDPYIRIAEDKDLYYKMEEVGTLVHVDDFLYKYRIHDGGLSTGKTARYSSVWHAYVLMKAFERRNYGFETNTSHVVDVLFQSQVKKTSEFRLGSMFISPLKKIKRLIKVSASSVLT